MRKYLYFILFTILLFSACNSTSKEKPVLTGKIENPITDTVILYYWTQENNTWREITDTSRIVDGRFSFDLQISSPTKAYLRFDNNRGTSIYIRPEKMDISFTKGNIYDYALTSSDTEKEYRPLRKQIAKLDDSITILFIDRIDPLITKMNQSQDPKDLQNTYDTLAKLRPIKDYYSYKKKLLNLEYINNHPNSLIAAGQLLDIIKQAELGEYPMDSAKILYKQLSDEVKKSQLGQLAQKKIQDIEFEKDQESALAIGKQAPDFSALSLISSDTIRLSDYKGKSYVLLDFWASWCRPCIQGLPFIKNLHKKYRKKNFVIIGISSDEDKDAYFHAIDKHELGDWPQIMDVQDFDEFKKGYTNKEDIKEKYYLPGIPAYLLINPDGVIIGKWIGSDEGNEQEMSEILESIFKGK